MENINVCVRVKPRGLTKDEEIYWKTEGNSIINLKSKEIFNFGKTIFFN
jgi:hypothetical protein